MLRGPHTPPPPGGLIQLKTTSGSTRFLGEASGRAGRMVDAQAPSGRAIRPQGHTRDLSGLTWLLLGWQELCSLSLAGSGPSTGSGPCCRGGVVACLQDTPEIHTPPPPRIHTLGQLPALPPCWSPAPGASAVTLAHSHCPVGRGLRREPSGDSSPARVLVED